MSRDQRSQGADIPIDTELDAARVQLAQLPLDSLSQPGQLPAGSRMRPPRNPIFTGRADELTRTAGALKAGRAVALLGAEGVGKTELAVEFAHRFGRYFAGGVFWLSFSMPEQVQPQVAACGAAMELRNDLGELALDDQLHLVLKAWQSDTPRLLIYDDCDDDDLLREWLPAGGGAHVLVTSRQLALDPGLRVTALPIGPLSRQDSVALLRQFRPDLPEGAAALRTLAEELDDLPLALRLAGGFLRRYRGQISPDSYLDQLRSQDVLDRAAFLGGDFDPARPNPGVSRVLFGRRRSHQVAAAARAFALTEQWLERADPSGRQALGLLTRAACFAAGEPVPRGVLVGAAGAGEGEEILARLVDLGILQPDAGSSVEVHQTVADLARAAPEDPAARRQAQDAMIEWARAANGSDDAEERIAVLPHLDFMTRRPPAGDGEATPDERDAALCFELGVVLWSVGDLRRARARLERALAIREERSGPRDPETIATISALGSLLSAQGDLAGAQASLERALQLTEETLGQSTPHGAAILTNLAWTLRYQGDLAGARAALERALEVSELTVGPDHPDTISRLNGLGTLLREQGDPAGARHYFERALDTLERTLGPDHPRTLQAINNLGLLLREQGDLAGARTCLQHALTVSVQTLGPDHLDTATALDNMGTLLQAEGDIEAARLHIERALEIREATLGPDHAATGTSYNNLGMLLRDSGDLEGSRPHLEQALIVSQRVLGPYDPQTATSYSNLGTLLLELGDLYGAQPHLERALAIREQGLGADHPDTATSLVNIARLHIAYGDLVGARTYLERALEIREEVLGTDSPVTADTFHLLGTVLRDAGDLETARVMFERSSTIRELALGPDHPDTLATLNELDEVVRALGGRRPAWPSAPLPDSDYFEDQQT